MGAIWINYCLRTAIINHCRMSAVRIDNCFSRTIINYNGMGSVGIDKLWSVRLLKKRAGMVTVKTIFFS
jgi:hypothetical protein